MREVLKKTQLNTKIHSRDSNFATEDGIVNFHTTIETQAVCYSVKNSFDFLDVHH